MQYNSGAQLDPSQVEYRSGGVGGRVAVGGGVSIIMLILALVFGINPGELMGGTSGSAGGSASGTDLTQCQTGADVAKDRNCRFVVYANTANAYWAGLLQGYQPIKTVLFDGQTPTGCGTASTQVGRSTVRTTRTSTRSDVHRADARQATGRQGGGGGGVRHRPRDGTRTWWGCWPRCVGGQSTGVDSAQVALEADCAGAYLAHVAQQPNSPISQITQDDRTASPTRRAVGDDSIRKSTGQVNPESDARQLGHASALVGFKTGDPHSARRSSPTGSDPDSRMIKYLGSKRALGVLGSL